MRKIVSLLLVLMLATVLVHAQSRAVTGRVLDENGVPVSGASILIKGTSTGASASAEGNFTISAKSGDVLVISSTNFSPREIRLNNQTSVAVTLTRSGAVIDEVVVTAMGIRRKAQEIGYSTARLNSAQIAEGRSPNLAQSLSGKVSGLSIQNRSSAVNATPRIVLRGLRSLTGDNTALIVLDGVPVPSNTINYINPNDVERVDVLKGGQAATLYGSDGVNGAIVITTRKGSRRPEIVVTHSSNAESVNFLPKFQEQFGSGSAYGSNMEENFFPTENQQYGPRYDGSLRGAGRTTINGNRLILPYSHIPGVRKSMWNTGYTGQSDISYRAGDENSSFYASYQNVTSSGIVPKDKYNRNSLRLNAGRNYGRLKLSFDATYTFDNADRTNADFYFTSLNSPSWIPMDRFKDWKNDEFSSPNAYFNEYYNNPWWELDNDRFTTRNSYFNGNITANVKATKNLDFTYRFAIANTNTFQNTTSNPFAYTSWAKNNAFGQTANVTQEALFGRGIYRARQTPIQGSFSDAASYGNRLNSDLFAAYNKSFGDVTVRALVGNNIQVRTSRALSTNINNLAIPDLFNVNNSTNGLLGGSNSKTEQRKIGNYADLTLGFKNYIFLHGAFRYDLSSVFYSPTRSSDLYGFAYGGADVSVILTDMIPSLKSKNLNNLKLRAGYNKNGNDNLGAYQLQNTYGPTAGFPFSGLLGTTVGNSIVAQDLRPENVLTSEVGFEATLWNNRITLEGSYYKQLSKAQILNVAVSSASGFSNYRLNAADVTNRGFEGDLKVNVFRNKNWNVNVNGNYTYSKNVVNQLFVSNGLNSLVYQNGANFSLNAEVGQMFPYVKTSVYTRDSLGRIVIDPTTGWPMKRTDFAGQGTTTPIHQVGLGFNVSFKGLTLIANAEYRGGNIVYNDLARDMLFTGTSKLSALYDRTQFVWPNSAYLDPNGSGKYLANTNIAANEWHSIYYGLGDLGNANAFNNVGEMHYSSGAFWKIRDVSLTYDLPQSVTNRITNAIKGISLSAWGRNVATFVAADNYFTDPELSNSTGNGQGVNTTGNTPPTRQLGVTLKVIL